MLRSVICAIIISPFELPLIWVGSASRRKVHIRWTPHSVIVTIKAETLIIIMIIRAPVFLLYLYYTVGGSTERQTDPLNPKS